MLTFSSFVLLVAGAQGADRNLLAKEDTWSGDLAQTSMGARRALRNEVGIFSFITKELPVIPSGWQSDTYVVPFAFVSSLVALFSSGTKLIFHNSCGFSKFLVNLIMLVATSICSYSSAQTTVALYQDDPVEQNFQEWLMLVPYTNITRLVAIFLNAFAFLLAAIGYNNHVTYPLAWVSMAMTTYANWIPVRNSVCKWLELDADNAFCKLKPLA